MQTAANTLDVTVWRGDDKSGTFTTYEVPRQESQTILDVVSWIQHHVEPSLSYRFACRVGMCGSCAMMVNGRPRWTCRTHVQKVVQNNGLKIAPLRNLPVVKDLVCDMKTFFDKWRDAEGAFRPTKTREHDIEPITPDQPQRQAAAEAIECINCAVCYAACDVVAANPDYLGPAALNRAWSLINDTRDGAYAERLKAVSGHGGCHNCHSQTGCQSHCPNELNPTLSIAGLKRASALAALRGDI